MSDSVSAGRSSEVVIYIIDNTAMQEGLTMTTMNAYAQNGVTTIDDPLRYFFKELSGRPLPNDERTAEVLAGVIAVLYGPALKELAKH